MLRREYEGETRDICKDNGIAYMAYSPTAQGLLAGRFDDEACEAPARRKNILYQEPQFSKAKAVYRELEGMASSLGCKPIHLALAWVLEQENVLTAIVGSRKPEQIKDFAQAGNLKLSAGDLRQLELILTSQYDT